MSEQWIEDFDKRLSRLEKAIESIAASRQEKRRIGFKSRQAIDEITQSLRDVYRDVSELRELVPALPNGKRAADWGIVTNELRDGFYMRDNGKR